MSEHKDAAGARGDEDVSAADEQALRAMFAALVQDAEPSALSPLGIQRQARSEQRSARDRRTKRIGLTRNTLIAAVVIGVMALVAPRLLSSSSSTATAASSSSAAAIPGADATSAAAAMSAAASYPAAPAPAGAATAGEGSSAASSAAAGGAASAGLTAAGDAPAGGAAAASSAAGSAASSGAASSEAMSSGAAVAPSAGDASSAAASSSSAAAGLPAPASSGPASSTSRGPCVQLPARALADVRAAMPGYGGAIRITSCRLQASVGTASGTATFTVDRSGRASCGQSVAACPVPAGAGARIGGTTDAYDYPGGIVATGRGGLVVTATATAGGPNRLALLAGVRALLRTLG